MPALAYKWIRIVRKETRTAYNEAKYLESLRKKGFPWCPMQLKMLPE